MYNKGHKDVGKIAKGILVLILFLMVGMLKAQDSIVITGIIVSHTNLPVEGVSVSVENSSAKPAITDEKGGFLLKSGSGRAWLIVSPIHSFKEKRVFVDERTNLKIFLSPNDISSTDDKINILSLEMPKKFLVSSVEDLKINEIHHNPVVTVDQFMQGRVAGMHVVNCSGMPGSGSFFSLRGFNSKNAQTQPLFIVDGIPLMAHGTFNSNLAGYDYNPLLAVNFHDISRLTIVKDPAITAAYGSRASNGIIFIETLDPSVTTTTIELDLRYGYSLKPNRFFPQLKSTQHRALMSEVLFSSGMDENTLEENYPSLFLEKGDDRYIDYQHETDWQSLIFKDSHFSNLNLSIKGGDGIARYGLSFGYINGGGTIKNTGHQGYNLRFVSRLNVLTWLKMDAGVALAYNNARLKEAATVSQTNPIGASLAKSPMLNPYQYDFDGNELASLSQVDDIGVSNPLATIENFEATNSNYDVIADMGLKGDLGRNLFLGSKISIHYGIQKEHIFYPNQGMELYADFEAHNMAKLSNNAIKTLFNNTYLSYNKMLGARHNVSLTMGANIQSNTYEFDWGLAKNAHENDQYRTINSGQDNLREIGGLNHIWNWVSFYENVNYIFQDKYIFSSSLSLEGSSRVGKQAPNTVSVFNSPFGLFYSAGVAWRVSEESFLQDIAWLEELKIRFSKAFTGNDDIGESNATKYYQAVKFRETVGLYPAVLPNYTLTYENSDQTNLGLDLSIMGNRWTVSIDLYENKTNNMIFYSPVEEYTGYSFRVENSAKMQNTGIEFTNFFRIIDNNNFKWDFQFNFTKSHNEILEIKGNKHITPIEGGQLVNIKGSPMNSFYGYRYLGVYATQSEAEQAGLVNDKGISYKAGDAVYEDISGPNGLPDGIINDFDKTILGSPMPDFFGGLTNVLSYRNLSLAAAVHFVKGNKIFNYVRYKNESMTGLENQSATVLNRWQYEGHQTDVPRALWNDPVGNSAFSSRWIEDGSFLRVKNITLRYFIPEQFLAFRNAEFYISANNAFTFTSYLGYDPEFAYSHFPMHQGIDYGLTPQAMQFIAGAKFNF
jgi:TonB-linked SusC/RagA family outer membrane protein